MDWSTMPPPPSVPMPSSSQQPPPDEPPGHRVPARAPHQTDMIIDDIGDARIRSTTTSSTGQRTRSRSRSMTPMEVASGPRQPPRPPDHPAEPATRGRSMTRRPVMAPLPPPPNHIDQLDVIDMLGLPQLGSAEATTTQAPPSDHSPASTRPYPASPVGSVPSTQPYVDREADDDPLLPLQQAAHAHNDDDDDDDEQPAAAAAAAAAARD
eukprot:5905067-Amphidinium_carterae.1